MDASPDLDFGIRWDYFGVVGKKKNVLPFYPFDTAAGKVGSRRAQLYDKDYNNFAPRFVRL